jgi:hypothetical protein
MCTSRIAPFPIELHRRIFVQIGLNSDHAKDEMATFAETYFKQFKRTAFGMIRLVRTARICSTLVID